MFDEGGLTPFGKCPIYQRINKIVSYICMCLLCVEMPNDKVSILRLKFDESCFSEERPKWLTE